VALNFGAAFVAFVAFRVAANSPGELGVFQMAAESVAITVGLNYSLGFLSELFVLASSAAAATLYGANADAFLTAVAEAAGEDGKPAARVGVASVDAAREAAAALRAVEALFTIRAALREQAAEQGGAAAAPDAKSSFLSLAALLAVANGTATHTFDASEWELTEAEAVRIARVFARYDRDGRLDGPSLQRLTAELGAELDEAGAAAALAMLDEDGSGGVELNEFVAFWAGRRNLGKQGGRFGEAK